MKTIEQIKQELDKDLTSSKGKRTNSVTKAVDAIQKAVIDVVIGDSLDSIIESIKPTLDKKIIEIYGKLPEVHIIKTSTDTARVEGTTHEKFDRVLQLVSANIPVFLTGEAGTGKNVICKQVAEALKLDFYFTNAVTQEYKLTGFIDASGKYQKTQFYDAFTKGGVFFLDEMDASIPEVLVILNAAIANRYFDFPIGRIEAHEDFRVIAAGNTNGKGADNNYTGRYCIDAASLDRFALVNINYSEKIELNICENNEELVNFAHKFRQATHDCGIECLFSYRSIIRIHEMEKLDIPLYEILEVALFKGMSEDDRNIIIEGLQRAGMNTNSKYYKACKGPNFQM